MNQTCEEKAFKKQRKKQTNLQARREVSQDVGKGGDEEKKPFHYELQHHVHPRQHLVVTAKIKKGNVGTTRRDFCCRYDES